MTKPNKLPEAQESMRFRLETSSGRPKRRYPKPRPPNRKLAIVAEGATSIEEGAELPGTPVQDDQVDIALTFLRRYAWKVHIDRGIDSVVLWRRVEHWARLIGYAGPISHGAVVMAARRRGCSLLIPRPGDWNVTLSLDCPDLAAITGLAALGPDHQQDHDHEAK